MIELDGSVGEGGGQIIRTALALSTLTGRPFRISRIRQNRPTPGLKAQHLTAINALKQIADGKTNEVALGSMELEYTPGKIKWGSFSFDVGTAGSVSLVLQGILIPCLFAPKKVTLKLTGGTCGLWQAPVEYFQHVLLPFVQRFADVSCMMKKRGYFPRGSGEVVVEVKPRFSLEKFDSFDGFLADMKKLKKIELTEQCEQVLAKGISHAAQELAERNVAERQAEMARLILAAEIVCEYQRTSSIGSGITLWARFNRDDEFHTILGSDAIGEKNKSAEDVGRAAADELRRVIDSGATVDMYMSDQILPLMALLPGSSVVVSEVTEHARTNMVVIEKFLPVRFVIEGKTISVGTLEEK